MKASVNVKEKHEVGEQVEPEQTIDYENKLSKQHVTPRSPTSTCSWAKADNIMHWCRVGHNKWYQSQVLD